MHKLAGALMVLTAILLGAAPAHAKLMFGKGESLYTVADVELRGPNGEDLFLGRMVVTRSFLLPFTVADAGFVLKVAGESKQYYPMPEGEALRSAQRRGLLPDPLPGWTLSSFLLLYGHSLWIALAAILGWPLAKRTFSTAR